MEFIFKDLVTKCWWSWVALAVAVGLAGITGTVIAHGAAGPTQAWLAIAAYCSLCAFFARPLLNAAYAGHRHLLTVCVWSFVLVLLGIFLSFFAFFAFFGSEPQKYDKVLNVVPVFVAIWAAALGWLVHFRLSTKAHRTNNAFAIIMEMRKSGEFLKRYEAMTRHFPAGSDPIPNLYAEFFPGVELARMHRESMASGEPADPARLDQAEAIQALKYVLNYFEFMAVGIKAGDLDEDLLYDTISSTVVRLYDRAKPLIDWTNQAAPGGAGQPLAFIDLADLVAKWRPRLTQHIADRANGAAAR